MKTMKNVLPIFIWAKANGEAIIVDRILVKIVPQLLKNSIKITNDIVERSETLEVDILLYDLIKKTAENLVGSSYAEI